MTDNQTGQQNKFLSNSKCYGCGCMTITEIESVSVLHGAKPAESATGKTTMK